jgi:hypothetical protein
MPASMIDIRGILIAGGAYSLAASFCGPVLAGLGQ